MDTEIHFVDVGQGNMVLIKTSDGKRFVCDCNITSQNEKRVLAYTKKIFGSNARIYAFICTHRDADHIRGIKKLDAQNHIERIWDSDYPGTTTNTTEYKEYMSLRRARTTKTIQRKKYEDYGRTRFRYLSDKDERLPSNANSQGVVLKVEQRVRDMSSFLSSAILTGDSDAETWRKAIQKDYGASELKASILMGGHHGSITFFDDDGYSKTNYYTSHIKTIKPDMSIISVGPNTHGHPNPTALKLYDKYSGGADNGDKVARTDKKGNMKLVLKAGGGWTLNYNQL